MIIFRGDTDRLELMTAARRFTPELIVRSRYQEEKSAKTSSTSEVMEKREETHQ